MSRRPLSAIRSVEADAHGVAPSTLTRTVLLAMLGLLFLGFSALGVWQVERRAWKLALIDRVNQRIHATAVPMPERSLRTNVAAADWEYRHVTVTGRYLPGSDTAVQAVTEAGAGYWLLTPLRTASGAVVLVNRGFVVERPSSRGAVAPAGAVADDGPLKTVDGLLRLSEPGGGFLRHNDAANDRWFSRDVKAIAAARGIDRVEPFFIDADAAAAGAPAAGVPDAPVGGLTVVRFHNNHLIYALTWFALALMSLAAAWQLTRDGRMRRRPGSRSRARAVDIPA